MFIAEPDMSSPSPTPAPAAFDPAAFLLAAVNQINPQLLLPLTESNVTVGTPQAMTSPVDGGVNTSLLLTALADQGYDEQATIYYARQDVGAYLRANGITTPTLNGAGLTNWATFFDAFNLAFGTIFTRCDWPVANFVPPVVDEPMTIVMPPGSLLFTGQFTVQLTLPNDLGGIITTTTLNGLVAPQALSALIPHPVITTGLTLSQLQGPA